QAEDGIRDFHVTGVQTCALPICRLPRSWPRPCAGSATTSPSASCSSNDPEPATARAFPLPFRHGLNRIRSVTTLAKSAEPGRGGGGVAATAVFIGGCHAG